MLSGIRIASLPLLFAVLLVLPTQAQNSEQMEVGPPPLHRAEPPAPGASAEELEKRGDELRAEKNFLDALDYYEAALRSASDSPSLLRKIGVCQLMMQRYKEAKRSFEQVIRADNHDAVAYNNLGVIQYAEHNYNAAIRQYQRALLYDNTSASYYSNLGAAYFAKKQFEKAILNYSKAVDIDPEIFEHSSHAGITAQLPSPEDRAHYDYVIAKLYARSGVPDRSLRYLKKAMEEGYRDIKNVYKDNEFSTLRKDPRFAELMAAKTTAISD